MALVEIKQVLKITTTSGLGTHDDPCRHVIDFVDPVTMEIIATYDRFRDSKLEAKSE